MIRIVLTLMVVLLAGCLSPKDAAFQRGRLAGKMETQVEQLAKTSGQKDLYIAAAETEKSMQQLHATYLENRSKCDNDDEVAWVTEDYVLGKFATVNNGVTEYRRLNQSTIDTLALKGYINTLNKMSDREINAQKAEMKEFFEKDIPETVIPALTEIAKKYAAAKTQPEDITTSHGLTVKSNIGETK